MRVLIKLRISIGKYMSQPIAGMLRIPLRRITSSAHRFVDAYARTVAQAEPTTPNRGIKIKFADKFTTPVTTDDHITTRTCS